MEAQTVRHYKIKRLLLLCFIGSMLLVLVNNANALTIAVNNSCPKDIKVVWGCDTEMYEKVDPGEQPINIPPDHACYDTLTLVGAKGDFDPVNTVYFYPFKEHDFSMSCKKKEDWPFPDCSCTR